MIMMKTRDATYLKETTILKKWTCILKFTLIKAKTGCESWFMS